VSVGDPLDPAYVEQADGPLVDWLAERAEG
jgi:hypothetical protein